MTTERIDVRVTEDGSREVRRQIEAIGTTSVKAAEGVDYLKKFLGFLAGALAIDKIRQYADAWSSASGSIRIATESQQQAIAVQEKLFQSAQKTRTAFTDITELYTRTARAGKELGASQNQIIKFTEGVGKSLAVQHVSAEQAKGALLQLGQAIGSGIVRAEEFNSILEGTPYILQIVAKNIKEAEGSVSKLRKIMLDGKLTSKAFFDAFLKGTKDIDEDFGKSSLTIGQGLTLINNALLKYVGTLDEALGVSHKFGEVAKFISENLGSILSVIGAVTAGLATYFGLIKGAQYAAAIAGQVKFVLAVAQGRAVMLGSAEAAAQMAAAQAAASLKSAQAAEAELLATQATSIAKLRSSVTLTDAKLAEIAATQAGLAVVREDAVAKLALANANIQAARTTIAAAEAAGALSYALATARAATADLAVAEQARSAALAELAVLGQAQARVSVLTTEAMVAQTAATRALSAAQVTGAEAATAANAATLAAANASAAATGRAAVAGGLLARTLSALGIGALANPWILLAAAITTVSVLLYKFADSIKIGVDETTTLKDLFSALYDIGYNVFKSIKEFAVDAFKGLGDIASAAYDKISSSTTVGVGSWLQAFTGFYSDVGTGFAGLVRGAAKTIDAIVGLFLGGAIAMANTFKAIPVAAEFVFKSFYNVAIEWIEKTLNATIDVVNKVRGTIGASLIESVQFTRAEVNTKELQDAGAAIVDSIDQGFKAEGGVFLKSVNDVFDRAAAIANGRRIMQGRNQADAGLDNPLGKPSAIVDEKALKALEKLKNDLRSLLDRIAPAEGALLEMAKAYKTLDEARAKGLITQKQESAYLSLLFEHYQDIIDPIGAVNRQLDQQTKLLGMSARARQVEAQFLQIQQDLLSKGVVLTKEDSAAMRERLGVMQALNEKVAAQDQLLANSVEARKAFTTQLQALQALLADPTSGFTAGDAATATNDLLKNAGIDTANTQIAIDAQLAQFQSMYAKINELRAANLISEQDAAALTAKTWAQEQTARLTTASDFFGQLSQLQSSKSRELARIGKAAAIAQATIKTYESATSAYASLAGIPVIGPGLGAAAAAAAIAAGVANIQAIRSTPGFMSGGYTGDVNTNNIAGVVHGREFVMNAQATADNRPALEAMNRGETVGRGGVNINIQNYGTNKDFEVQQLSENDYRIIARDEARKVVPETVAGEISQPNSRVSKALENHTQGGARKR